LSESGTLRTPALKLGWGQNSLGNFNLNGGALNVTTIDVGHQGIGVFNQTAGVNNPTRIWIGTSISPGTNVYNMSGGSLTAGATTMLQNGQFNYNGGDAWLGHLNLFGNARVEVNGPGLETYTMHFQDDVVQAVIDVKDFGFEVNFTGFEQIDEIKKGARLGRNGGSWTGKGIISSTAAANASSAHPTAVGYALGGIGVMIEHVYEGDSNLDGAVDINDFASLAINFNAFGKHWYQGDFNYDGTPNVADFALLAANFNQSLTTERVRPGPIPEPQLPALFVSLAAALKYRPRQD
jgi:hypothetical protein